MTRRSFRATVDAPRPLSAIGLVGVASATLAMTGQILGPAVVLQAAALLAAVALRERPLAWQRGPVWPNVGLAAVVLASLGLFARGSPALIVLAHFAFLTQGLQLLDARPRRSEFLLVALALFQVVLASNLTDSLLFLPLLAIFLPTAVWTLLVHTLRTEALEAGDAEGAVRAIGPGLLRTTLFASSVSLLVALGLFLVLPRLQAGFVRSSFLGHGGPRAGFSDQVALGDLGRIRGDPRVVLRVTTLRGTPPAAGLGYWRGLAFDRFDGRTWSLSSSRRLPLPGDPELGLDVLPARGRAPIHASRVEQIVRESVTAGVIFASGDPVRIEGPLGRLERDSTGGLYAPAGAEGRVRYAIASDARPRDLDALRTDHVSLPGPDGARYLALPALGERVLALAQSAVAGSRTDLDRALALESYLRRTGRYTDVPPTLDPDDPVSPVERFLLGERAGHCEYFASAMVVMARSLGLPARLVNGFAGGRENPIGGFLELTGSDAHAWVELHFERAGWVAFDPTPPDLRLRGASALSLGERIEALRSALELWWFDHVVEFDRVDQLHALGALFRAWRSLHDSESPPLAAARPGADAGTLRGLGTALAFGVALALGGAAGFALLRRRDRARARVPGSYRAALRLLARRGLVRGATVPAREFAHAAADRLPRTGAEAFARLTEAYLVERFGGRAASDAETDLARLRDSLRA